MPPWVLFLVFGALFFLMMRSGCGSHAAGHGHRRHSGDSSERTQAPEKLVDPVCGMTVETRTAKSAVHEGRAAHRHGWPQRANGLLGMPGCAPYLRSCWLH